MPLTLKVTGKAKEVGTCEHSAQMWLVCCCKRHFKGYLLKRMFIVNALAWQFTIFWVHKSILFAVNIRSDSDIHWKTLKGVLDELDCLRTRSLICVIMAAVWQVAWNVIKLCACRRFDCIHTCVFVLGCWLEHHKQKPYVVRNLQ